MTTRPTRICDPCTAQQLAVRRQKRARQYRLLAAQLVRAAGRGNAQAVQHIAWALAADDRAARLRVKAAQEQAQQEQAQAVQEPVRAKTAPKGRAKR